MHSRSMQYTIPDDRLFMQVLTGTTSYQCTPQHVPVSTLCADMNILRTVQCQTFGVRVPSISSRHHAIQSIE